MNLSITIYFLLFFIYSICGWILEVGLKLREFKRFINRGFLIGPYCPIYGYGAVMITILLNRYKYDFVVLFIMTMVTCGVLEYLTSFVMEKMFKARWWDYSKNRFNLNGRVCLETMIPFGLFGLLITYVTNPFIIDSLNKVNSHSLNIIAIVLLIIFIIDNIISFVIIGGFRKVATQIGREGKEDNTEQITKRVREVLINKSWAHRRLVNAYPRLITIKEKIKEIKEEVKENATEIKNTINEKVNEVKESITEKKEELKNTISEKKEELKNSFSDTGKDDRKK